MLVSTSMPSVSGRSVSREKYLSGLRTAVFSQGEIIFGQAIYDLSVLVAHRGQHVHHLDFDRQGGHRLVGRLAAAWRFRSLPSPAGARLRDRQADRQSQGCDRSQSHNTMEANFTGWPF